MRNHAVIAALTLLLTSLAVGAAAQQPQAQRPSPAPQPVAQPRPQPVGQPGLQPVAQAEPQQVVQPAPQADLQRRPSPASVEQGIPLQVQVVISRYQGEKRISSLPYILSVKAGGGRSSLRLGSRLPVSSTVFAPPAQDGKPAPAPLRSFNYENVGTNIDCDARAVQDGRFEVQVIINESSVVSDSAQSRPPGSSGDEPAIFRSYQSTNTVFVKDGETAQFTAATDRISGEVVRVEVKVTIVK